VVQRWEGCWHEQAQAAAAHERSEVLQHQAASAEHEQRELLKEAAALEAQQRTRGPAPEAERPALPTIPEDLPQLRTALQKLQASAAPSFGHNSVLFPMRMKDGDPHVII
jgi:hypothetical protein